MSNRNPFDSQVWKDFESHVQRNLIPSMRDNATVLMLAPEVGKFDLQFAVQIGAAVLLEKPLLVIMPTGCTPPPKLERVADRIVYMDGPGDERIQDEISGS